MGAVEGGGGGGGGGGVDLALGFKNFWDGVYNFFFLPAVLYNLPSNCARIHAYGKTLSSLVSS